MRKGVKQEQQPGLSPREHGGAWLHPAWPRLSGPSPPPSRTGLPHFVLKAGGIKEEALIRDR